MGTKGSGYRQVIPPSNQAISSLDQAGPVQNTYYDILPLTPMARVYAVNLLVADTGETLQVRVIEDGQTYAPTQAANAGTTYYLRKVTTGYAIEGNDYSAYASYLIEAKNVQISIRKTTANGAGNIQGNCKYARW